MKPETDSAEGEGPLWNMAQLYYWRLSKLLEQKSEAYMNGNIVAWHRSLSELAKTLSVVKHTDKDVEDIMLELERAQRLIHLQITGSLRRQMMMIREQAETHLETADFLISDLIKRYNLVFPVRPEKGIEAVYKRLKLKEGDDAPA